MYPYRRELASGRGWLQSVPEAMASLVAKDPPTEWSEQAADVLLPDCRRSSFGSSSDVTAVPEELSFTALEEEVTARPSVAAKGGGVKHSNSSSCSSSRFCCFSFSACFAVAGAASSLEVRA